jgi:ribosomal protein S18 acetylase RimI-like enzyme
MPKAQSETSLKRESAGRYTSRDGRFAVEQSSGRWMLVDAEAVDDLGLPLVRGPFSTLDEAKAAIEAARSGPAPTSDLARRIADRPPPRASREPATSRGKAARPVGSSRSPRQQKRPAAPREPAIELRDFHAGDGKALRGLWKDVGLRSLGDDDDRNLAGFATRNPGLLVVATAEGEVVGSALAGWDGRRGWLYHVATAERHRRKGIARRMVRRLEGRLGTLGCPKVNVLVRDDSAAAAGPFWAALGYEVAPVRKLGKDI